MSDQIDPLVFGHRLRHFRKEAGLTLDDLGARIGKPAPYLSTIENGKREPKLSLISMLASSLDVSVADLLDPTPPSKRARLEISLARIQSEALYRELALPDLKASARLPDDVLETIVGLFEGLKDRAQVRAATPEEARKENANLRRHQRLLGNHFVEIELLSREALTSIGYTASGALSQRNLLDLASHFGFTIHSAGDIPHAVRSVTDLHDNRIFVSPDYAVITPGTIASSKIERYYNGTVDYFFVRAADVATIAETKHYNPGPEMVLNFVGVVNEIMPELLTLGEYKPETRTGPATWLRCVIERRR